MVDGIARAQFPSAHHVQITLVYLIDQAQVQGDILLNLVLAPFPFR